MLSRFFIASKGRPEYTPIWNVGLVIIADTNLFQKPQNTLFLLE